MSERRLFSVLFRTLGVLVALQGGGHVLWWITLVVWVWSYSSFERSVPLGAQELVYGLLVLLLGSIMIRWPERVVELAWFENAATSSD